MPVDWKYELIKDDSVYCPICDSTFPISEYLKTVFQDTKVLWFANMTTHQRHSHISYYNRWVRFQSYFYDYRSFKSIVNERCKRNILRKCKKFLWHIKFKAEYLVELQGTTPETLLLAIKVLGGDKDALIQKLRNRPQNQLIKIHQTNQRDDNLNWNEHPITLKMVDIQFGGQKRIDDYVGDEK